jgi:PTS system beta-glucosides-specific IIC component
MKEPKTLVGRIANTCLNTIADIFWPLVNVLTAAGILKGILAILVASNALSTAGDTYLMLSAMADALFYFLPLFVAVTAAKRFGCNRYTALLLACILLYPSLVEAFSKGAALMYFGLPALPVSYPSNVIPIIMAVGLLRYTEKLFSRLLPEVVEGFLTPLLSIFIVGSLTFFVLGPIGNVLGLWIAAGYTFLYGLSPAVSGLILGGLIQVLVIFALHWATNALAMNNIAVHGSDTIVALSGPSIFGQAGAMLGVCIKVKDKEVRARAIAATISAFFGITEPALYAFTLPLKMPLIAGCIGGAVGGMIAGIAGSAANSFAIPSVATLPIFYGPGFLGFVFAAAAAVIVGMVLTLVMKFDCSILTKKEAGADPDGQA